MSGEASFHFGDIFWRACGHNLAAAITAFGAEINNPVGLFDDIKIMLNDNHGIALIHQFLQHFHQFSHIFKMQASGGFIENIKRAASGALSQLFGQLDPLRFATRKRCRLLANFNIGEPNPVQGLQLVGN